uniref:Uncharacterized protein n=1 Tax=Theileria annulata TaxID=5874 RepID=A0A3B0NEV9_THEAN
MDQKNTVARGNNVNQDRSQRIDESQRNYNPQFGYQTMPEEREMNMYQGNQYVIQQVDGEQIQGNYIDPMERPYVYNYPIYEGGIPVYTSIQPYGYNGYHATHPYEPVKNLPRIVYTGQDLVENQRFQTVPLPYGKVTHRQKKNFLCC